MRFGFFAYVVIELCTGHIVPSASLEMIVASLNSCLKEWIAMNKLLQTVFHSSHLVQHLDTVLTEPVMVVWFPWSPVGEGHNVFIAPGVHTRHSQVIQTSPHVAGSCRTQFFYYFVLRSCNRPLFWIHTKVQVTLKPALLRHGTDGYKVCTQTPAAVSGIVPCLFVFEGFVAVLSKLIPVNPWTPQLCRREEERSHTIRAIIRT